MSFTTETDPLSPESAAPADARPVDAYARALELGRLMIGLVAEKLGEAAAAAWVDAILTPTRSGTAARKASDKANGQLVRNVLAVAGDGA